MDDFIPDSPSLNSCKTLYQLSSYISCESYLDAEEGGGNATVVFNDKNFRFWKHFPWKYLNTRDWGDEKLSLKNVAAANPNSSTQKPLTQALQFRGEIKHYQDLLKHYSTKVGGGTNFFEALYRLSTQNPSGVSIEKVDGGLQGGILIPIPDLQNVLAIHYLGKDGKWWAGWKGIVTSIGVKKTKGATPTFTINARTPDRFHEYSYSLTGQNNIGKGFISEQQSLSGQEGSIAFTNKYNGLGTGEIIVQALKDCNDFFLKQHIPNSNDILDQDYRYFKVDKIFGFGKKLVSTDSSNPSVNKIEFEGERGYPVNSDKFLPKTWDYRTKISPRDIYPGQEVFYRGKPVNNNVSSSEWIQLLMADEFFTSTRAFQNLVRTTLSLFTVDKMTIKEVLDVVRKIALVYIYFNGNGDLVVERPYFDTNLIGQIPGQTQTSPSNIIDPKPLDYDTRYVISEQDISFLSYDYNRNESAIITRTNVEVKPNWLPGISPELSVLNYQGKSESSPKTVARFGDRLLVLNSIVSPNFTYSTKTDLILSSYCWAQKLLLNSKASSLSFEFDQRPDIQLNRNLLFLEQGMYGLTKRIQQTSIPAENRLTTQVTCAFPRYVGYQLINPWRYRLHYTSDSQGGYELVPWELVDPIKIPIEDKTKSTGTQTGNEILDIGESYNSVKDEIQRMFDANFINFTDEDQPNWDVVNCYVLRPSESNPTGVNDNEDKFYFIWKDGSKTNIEILKGSGGDPQSNGSADQQTVAAKLEQGIYRYDGPNPYTDPQTKQPNFYFSSTYFNWYGEDSKFQPIGDRNRPSKDVSVLTVNKDDKGNQVTKTYQSTLQPGLIGWYGDNITNYNTTELCLALNQDQSWNNVLNAINSKSQQFLTVCVKDYSQDVKDRLEADSKDTQNISDLDETQTLFLYLNCLQNPQYNSKILKNGEKNKEGQLLKVEGDNEWVSFPEYDEKLWTQSSNIAINGDFRRYLGMFNVTQKIIDLDPAFQTYKDFISDDINKAKVAQKSWFNTYFNQLLLVLGKKINPTYKHTIGQLLDAIMTSLEVKGGNFRIYFTLDDKSPKNYPVFESSLNTKGGVIALMHFGVQYFNIANQDIPNQVENVCYYLNKFYRLDIIERFLNLYDGTTENKSSFNMNEEREASLNAKFSEINQLMNSKVTHCSGLVKLLGYRTLNWNNIY